MIRTFEELKALEDKEVFIERPWAGYVTFKVTLCTEEAIRFKSISISGFDFSFEGPSSDSHFESYAKQRPVFSSHSEALLYNKKQSESIINEYVNQHKDNKELFIKDMITQAYHAQCDPEYGDYDKALSIQAVAKIFYPELNL